MVEGPKVVCKQKRLQCLINQYILKFSFCSSHLMLEKLIQSEVLRIFCVGKELFIVLNNDNVIRLHFGMNGSERITKTECLIENLIPKYSRKKLTLLVQFTVDYLYLFDSTIAIKTVTYANKIEKNLVVDVMSTRFENNTCVENLKLHNVSIHEAIMDQTLMPGVGNVIKCEGLFNASIHPNSLACNIPHDKLCELVN
jgi:endonuclease VIII-like 3